MLVPMAPLVDYSSSEDEAEKEPEQDQEQDQDQEHHNKSTSLKRRHEESSDLPPLPSKFHDLYASTSRVSTTDDPSLHGGRKRVTPHIEGNWPTHLYIEWCPSSTEYEILDTLISEIRSDISYTTTTHTIKSLLTSDLGAPLPLHVSLSRSIGLATDIKDAFTTSLERTINTSNISPFQVGFSGLSWVSNYDQTRWFLVLRIERPAGNNLNKLLAACNGICQRYGQPALYTKIEEASPALVVGDGIKRIRSQEAAVPDLSDAFHVSIAWTLAQPSDDLIAYTKSVLEHKTRFSNVRGLQVKVGEIKAKVGNLVTNMRLPNRMQESRGMFGF
ncbi:hypothetical protein PVAG01_06318 [Phlyctema vagabunda]|uniref:U6 snRNA phosphodiesterase n=1 Tax=Phlyctema vagabunda TaxID=108571 RepID=A0ABR4PFQ4_9HELO